MSRGLLHRLRDQARRKRRAAPAGNPPNGVAQGGGLASSARYLTDGVHLYEVERTVVNYGVLGGYHVVARDCKTEDVREMGTLEVALCTAIGTPSAGQG